MTDIISRGAAAAPTASAAPVVRAGVRLREIDMLRGLVIALMALDHVRDYFHRGAFAFDPLDPNHTSVALYATRWITHLCASTFVFLAGVAAFLQAAKGKSTPELSRFLLTRGVWLVLLELTVLSFGWSFALPYPFLLQVIWAIGWSMIALAGLVWAPRRAVLVIGLVIVGAHNLLDVLTPRAFGPFALAWTFLHEGGPLHAGGAPIGFVAYPVLPWIGVMALGYGLGDFFLEAPSSRDRKLFALSVAMLGAFLVLRSFNLYGEPEAWHTQGDVIRSAMVFLDVTKYPPSLLYVLATLGLAFALVPLLGRLNGPAARSLYTFGAVPLFFYVLHVYLVHGLAIVANAALGRDVEDMFNFFANMVSAPERYLHLGFPLAGAYLAWLVVLAMLFPLCRWWGAVKRNRHDWWLSYL